MIYHIKVRADIADDARSKIKQWFADGGVAVWRDTYIGDTKTFGTISLSPKDEIPPFPWKYELVTIVTNHDDIVIVTK